MRQTKMECRPWPCVEFMRVIWSIAQDNIVKAHIKRLATCLFCRSK